MSSKPFMQMAGVDLQSSLNELAGESDISLGISADTAAWAAGERAKAEEMGSSNYTNAELVEGESISQVVTAVEAATGLPADETSLTEEPGEPVSEDTAPAAIPMPPEMDPDQNPVDEGDIEGAHEVLLDTMAGKHTESESEEEEDPESNGGINAKTSEFQEQCFLLSYVFDLAKRKKDVLDENKKLPYVGENLNRNASLLVDGSPFGFINKLTQNPNHSLLHDIEVDELAHLQPAIRLFKIIQNSSGDEIQQEIKFDSNLTPNDVGMFVSDKYSRGHGVGIKDFTFAYEADTPFAMKRSVTAKLTLFANSFDELLRSRAAPDGTGEYNYAELALKTGNFTPDNLDLSNSRTYENSAKLNFRLKAVVGWASLPPDTNSTLSSELRKVIYDSFITLQLTPVIHTFNIDDNGRVVFTIDYLAYAEEAFDGNYYNIFSDPDVGVNMIKRKLRGELVCATGECKQEVLDDLKKEEQNQILLDKQKSLQIIIKKLLGVESCAEGISAQNKIYNIVIPYENLQKFMSKGPYADLGEITDDLADSTDPTENDYIDDILRAAEIAFEGDHDESLTQTPVLDKWNIGFFYVSDLIDVILEGIEFNIGAGGMEVALEELTSVSGVDAGTLSQTKNNEKARLKKMRERFKKLRVMLGPVEIVNQKNAAESEFVNLGDLPISVKYFNQWLITKTLQRNESSYPLTAFLNAFFTEFIRDFLNNDTCFAGTIKQRTHLSKAVITSYKNSKSDYDEVVEALYDAFSAETVIEQQVTDSTDPAGMDMPAPLEVEEVPGTQYSEVSPRLNVDQYGKRPLLNISADRGLPYGDGGFDNQLDYMVYYASRVTPKEALKGKRGADEGAGIFHYGIGSPRGIVKTIQLQKTEAPGHKEYRFELEGYDGLTQLREVYDVNVKTYLNVNAFPGSYIFVNPKTFAPALKDRDLTLLGVGGYCMITRTEHSMGPGYADSLIVARWVAGVTPE